jgi:hypothetical protein
MINNDILEYIRAQRQAGVADEMIRANLRTGGWEDADIAEALTTASPQAPMPTEPIAAVNSSPLSSQVPAEAAAAQPGAVEAQPIVEPQETPAEPQVVSQPVVDMSQFKPSAPAPAEFPLQTMTSGAPASTPVEAPSTSSTPVNAVISTMPMEEEKEPASGGAVKKIIIGLMVLLLLAAGGAVAYALLGGFAAAEPTPTDESEVPAFPLPDDTSDAGSVTTPTDIPNDSDDVMPALGASSTSASDTSATLPMASSTTATETPASSL